MLLMKSYGVFFYYFFVLMQARNSRRRREYINFNYTCDRESSGETKLNWGYEIEFENELKNYFF